MLLDPELGIKPEDKEALDVYGSVPEKVEAHQAEEPPLVWSDERKTWATRTDNPERATSSEKPAVARSRTSVHSDETAVPIPFESKSNASSEDTKEPIYVQFEDEDPDNPFDWSPKRKWIITAIGKILVGHYRDTFSKLNLLGHPDRNMAYNSRCYLWPSICDGFG